MKISIQPSAVADLRAGFHFYEQQQKGLGGYFLDSLHSDIDSLLLHAGIHSRQFGKFRLLSSRFPYAVYDELHQDLVLIRAVLDLRREPSWISQPLKRPE
jgi:hypothetical protein